MSIFISNFGRTLADWVRRNRGLLIRWFSIAAVSLAVLIAVVRAVEEIRHARYEKRVQALEKQFQEASAKATAAQARADDLGFKFQAKEAEAQHWQSLARAADEKMAKTGVRLVTLKETYENTRNAPLPVSLADASCADACRELSRLGYDCK